jgi:hypothetical protein
MNLDELTIVASEICHAEAFRHDLAPAIADAVLAIQR